MTTFYAIHISSLQQLLLIIVIHHRVLDVAPSDQTVVTASAEAQG